MARTRGGSFRGGLHRRTSGWLSRANDILGKATINTLHKSTPGGSKSQNIHGETSINSLYAKALSRRSNSGNACGKPSGN